MLAALNIHPGALSAGIMFSILLMALVGLFRNPLLGFLGGLVGCGMVGWIVAHTGGTELNETFLYCGVPAWMVLGAIGGALMAYLRKRARP